MPSDLIMMIEEERAAIRDAERELTDAMSARAELEKKIAHLQWQLERLKRLYALTSALAQDETGASSRHRSSMTETTSLFETKSESNGRPGTTKQAMIDVLREHRRKMAPREIWAILQKRGVKINSNRPVEVVASTMRGSIVRNQNIFIRDGSLFGLVEWQGTRAT